MNVFLSMLGCRLNEAELQGWARAFARAGHRVVAAPEDAALVVLNTCAVTAEAARKSRQLVHRLHRVNPGARLVVTGTYEGLQTPATVARLHVAPKGMRGPAMVDLMVTGGTAGRITGTLMLTDVQADHVRRSRVYVQLHSEKAPEGNLWGWLLP